MRRPICRRVRLWSLDSFEQVALNQWRYVLNNKAGTSVRCTTVAKSAKEVKDKIRKALNRLNSVPIINHVDTL